MSLDGQADFRSDTVTRPTPEMYDAMRNAPLGDDVLGTDPTVGELQEYAAELFGTEAAIFVPSGTMGNQIAMRVHTRLGDEVILEKDSHIFYYEQGGLAQLSGIQARTLPGKRGQIDPDDVRAAIRPVNEHFPVTRLVVLENTHNGSGGAVLPIAYMRAMYDLTRELGVGIHLDGARIANAEIASGTPLADYGACADSVTCCLSKGLGAPAGTVLMGNREFIREARRVRKVFGGGMRQAGILAGPGLVALRDMRSRLLEDHVRASALARGLSELPGVSVVDPETNMVYASMPGRAAEVARGLSERDVLALNLDADTMRFVTHKDVNDGDVTRALEAVADVLGE